MRADMRLTKTKQQEFRSEVRRLLADYMASEGCGCCGNSEAHDAAKSALGKLLRAPKWKDGSGYDFSKFRSPKSP